MTDSVFTIQYLKDFMNSQIYDEEKWAFNMKLLHAAGLFGLAPLGYFRSLGLKKRERGEDITMAGTCPNLRDMMKPHVLAKD
ncbi:hypothetical protein K1719_045324 [Acacia pycnantha]|nr:hypothetical protein K1719_045324 [Acacia pycnantha]